MPAFRMRLELEQANDVGSRELLHDRQAGG